MSNEKQSKMPDWRQGLLQWEQSGGNTEPKEDLLWEKLHTRLQPKRTRRKINFFRIAAMLLFLLAISFLFLQKKRAPVDAPVVSKSFIKHPTQDAVVKKVSPIPVIIPSRVNYVPTKSLHKVVSLQADTNNAVILPQEEKIVSVDTFPVLTENKEPGPIAVAVPQKRKIKVMHLNDLNSPPPPTFAILKEDWNIPEQLSEEVIVAEPSIWPGKKKHKSFIVIGN